MADEPKLPIRIVRSAAKAIAEAADWWQVNRTKAPEAFMEDLDSALHLIALQPNIGAKAKNMKLVDVRRIHLSRVHYYLYYRIKHTSSSMEILAFWHSSRGSEPNL